MTPFPPRTHPVKEGDVSFVAKLRWRIRKGFWNAVARFRYRGISPLPVKDLARLSRRPPTLTPIPLDRAFPSIPIPNVHRGDREPPGDRAPLYTLRSAVAGLLSRLASVFGPNQPDLPPIDADPQRAVDRAYTAGHRRTARRKAEATGVADRWALQPPVVPPELKGSPDLGGLAVRGPYAGYLHEVTSREFEWDLRDLGQFEHRPGLYRLGVRVLFRANGARSALEPFRIESDELGTTKPGDRGWPQAMRLAVCAASTHTSLVRHFNWVHLLGGEYLSLVCRNHLSPDHPLARLLWPHTFGTQQSNRLAVQSQLVPGGEFESFSLTHRGVCDLIGESVGRFQMSRFDPYDDALARGLSAAGIELPTESNMRRLFDVMLRHATRYLDVYYLTDEAVRQDRAIGLWVDGMNALVPNGARGEHQRMNKWAQGGDRRPGRLE